MAIGPTKIFEIMELSWCARMNNDTFNVMLEGEAGVGKSEILQQWASKKRQELGQFDVLDLRLAYLESPDIVGFPKEVEFEGRYRTIHALPGFWPVDPNSKGIIILEEINRGTTGVMNTMMQLLTDRKILSDDPNYPDYVLPDGWIIAAAVNPETAQYDVTPMCQALRDRFSKFEVAYNHNEFVSYIKSKNWHPNVINFIQSGIWVFKKAEQIATANGGQYISPRTWSRVNAMEWAREKQPDASRALHRNIAHALLGKHYGDDYHKMCFDDSPVLASDLIRNPETALQKLKEQSQKSSYSGEKISITVESICENYEGWHESCGFDKSDDKIDEATMIKAAMIIPSDQAIHLLMTCINEFSIKNKITGNTCFKRITDTYPELLRIMKDHIKLNRS